MGGQGAHSLAGHVFIARGDVTRVSADALGYPASEWLHQDITGFLLAPFSQHIPGFREQYAQLQCPQPPRSTNWIDLRPQPDDGRKPYGVVVVVSTGGALTQDQEGQLFNTLPGPAGEVRDAPGDDRYRLLRTTYAVWQAIEEAAARLRRDGPRAGQEEPLPYLVALPTIGHGKGGNRRIPLPSACVLLRPSRAAAPRCRFGR